MAVNSQGVLLLGKSGSGKSDLALRLLVRGSSLVADDQVILRKHESGVLLASVDEKIRGLLEIRGVGLVRYPVATNIPVTLVVELAPRDEIEHIPAPATYELLGVSVPKIKLDAFDASATAKIHAALYSMRAGGLHTGFFEAEEPEV